MVEMLFPRIADNRYPGRRLGLWLFGLMPLKIAMGLNVMVNAPEVAQTADGVPVSSFGAAAAAGLASLVVLLRYRSLVPLAFLLLLIEQSGRMSLRLLWPVQRIDAPGSTINLVLVALLALGFILSIWRPRQASGGV